MASSDYLGFAQLGQKYIPTGMDIAKNQEDLQMAMLDRKVKQLLHEDNQYKYNRKREFHKETDALANSMKEKRQAGTKEGEGFELGRQMEQKLFDLSVQYPEMTEQLRGMSQAYAAVKDADKQAFHDANMKKFTAEVQRMVESGEPIDPETLQGIALMNQIYGAKEVNSALNNLMTNNTNLAKAKAKGSSGGSKGKVFPTETSIDQATGELVRSVESTGMEFDTEEDARAAGEMFVSIAEEMWRRNPVDEDGNPRFSHPNQARQAAMDMMFESGHLYVEGYEGEEMSLGRLKRISDKEYWDPNVKFNPNPKGVQKNREEEAAMKESEGSGGPSNTGPTPRQPKPKNVAPVAPQGVPDPYGDAFTNPPPAPMPPGQGGPSEMLPTALDPNFQVMQGGRPGWSGNVLDPTGGRDQTPPPLIDTSTGPGTRVSPASPPAAPMQVEPLGREGLVARDNYMDSWMETRGEGATPPKARKEFLDSWYATRGPSDPTKGTPEPMMTAKEPRPDVLEMIKEFEGYRENAYQDSTGKWTIGYGTTAGVRQGDKMSPEEAEIRLKKVVQNAEKKVDRDFPGLKVNEKEAVASLVYNIGWARFAKSKAYRALKKGDKATFLYEAFDPQQGFVKAGGKTLKGLQKRRLAEMKHFMG